MSWVAPVLDRSPQPATPALVRCPYRKPVLPRSSIDVSAARARRESAVGRPATPRVKRAIPLDELPDLAARRLLARRCVGIECGGQIERRAFPATARGHWNGARLAYSSDPCARCSCRPRRSGVGASTGTGVAASIGACVRPSVAAGIRLRDDVVAGFVTSGIGCGDTGQADASETVRDALVMRDPAIRHRRDPMRRGAGRGARAQSIPASGSSPPPDCA